MTQHGWTGWRAVAGLTALWVSAGSGYGEDATRVRVIGANPTTATCDAVVVSNGDLIHSGQVFPVGTDGKVIGQSPAEQARAALARLDRSLQAAGSGLAGLVRVTVYADSDETAEIVAAELPSVLPAGTSVALTLMAGQLPTEPTGAKLSIDAVAIPLGKPVPPATDKVAPANPGVRHVAEAATAKPGEFAELSMLPAGDVLFISGQAEKGATLEEATDRTLEGLARTLDWLGLGLDDVVETRSFVAPMEGDLNRVRERFRHGFANRPVPASTFLECTAPAPSIEIEYVVSSRKVPLAERLKRHNLSAEAGDTVAYLTPPWMTASPVFCRATQVQRGPLVYFGGVAGDPAAEGGEIRDLFRRLDRTARQAGCDLRHLAKATYFVSRAELVPQMGKIRPEFYDPKRPPAASLATVRGAGGAGVRLDMIGGESPAIAR
jgi:enamine deaminase RidA (YjgF/YER057c/UK114 family)